MSADYSEGFFPRYIDRPRLVGVFEMDEFAVVFGSIFGLILSSLAFPNLDSLIVMVGSIVIGLSSGIMYKKFKNGRPNGYTMQLLYKHGISHPESNPSRLLKYPYLSKNKCVPYGFTKELIN